jgi:phosphoribosylglycinamide formyltransferase-1
MMKCAVFASGGGTNFQSLLERRDSGELHVDFALFIGNNSSAQAFGRARSKGIPDVHIAPSHFANQEEYSRRLMELLKKYSIELIILAGYMKMIPVEIVRAFHNRIVNIHPALLPAFGGKGLYGKLVHQAVLDYGAKVSGVTVHFVDEHYDHGPVILQRTTDVRDDDTAETLAARILKIEHDSFWRAIELVAQKAIHLEGRRVVCIR